MATNKTLDPTTCTTAGDAFKYPLPQVRQFHRTLTADLDEKNARLRTLVGGSYRQLLGTAEAILQMREDIRHVEDKLGRVGQGCGRSVIGEKASGLARLGDNGKDADRGEELQWSTRMKVLEMCGFVVGKLLRRRGNGDTVDEESKCAKFVLAAKVLVLSRLLAKSIRDQTRRSARDQEQVEKLGKKLGLLRRKLLRAIDMELETVGESRENLVEALSAYSLATNSGARDVLRHFLHVRGEAMTLSFDDVEREKQDSLMVVKGLELYSWTLLDVQALFPKRLPEALSRLKSQVLLKDEALRRLEYLRVDTCEKWFGDEILFFIPYIRHDDLDGSQSVDLLKGWAKKASDVLLEGFGRILAQSAEFKAVVDLRSKILRVWNREGGKAKGFDPTIVFDGLRRVVNERLVELLETRISKLHLVGTEVEATLSSWQQGITDTEKSLWDQSMLDLNLSQGAVPFKQDILARTYGRNDAISRVFTGYMTWRHLVDEIITVIEQLRKQRWDDDSEDIEDEVTLQSRSTLLNIQDPQLLQDHLNSSLKEAFDDLHDKLTSLLATYAGSEQIGPISVYILRIIRDIRIELPKIALFHGFGLTLISALHERLAATISKGSLERFSKSFTRKRVAGRSLWEGDPALPVQPSPSTFRFIHEISLGMEKAGADLWSSAAVNVLKERLKSELSRRWSPSLDSFSSQDAEIANDQRESSGNGQGKKDLLVQSLFDVSVLQAVLESSSSGPRKSLEAIGGRIEAQIELEPASITRLKQGGKEYWKRTNLLFGLLA